MISVPQLLLLVLITIGGITAAFLTDTPFAVGFLPGLACLIILARRTGSGWESLRAAAFDGMRGLIEVVWILLLLGLLVPAWTASGTIPYMVDLGLRWLNPDFFIVSAFVITGLVSMILGSALGTLSSIGIALMGAAGIVGVSQPLIAGALISGALLGDRTSPFSSINQLTADSIGLPKSDHIRAIFPTTLIAFLAAAAAFTGFDWFQGGAGGHVILTSHMKQYFFMTPLLLIPPIFLIGAILFRWTTRNALIGGLMIAVFLGTILQDLGTAQWASYLIFGYSGDPAVLQGKGLIGMLALVIFVLLTGAFNGILRETGFLDPYIRNILGTGGLGASTLRAGGFAILLSMVTCNQALPVMISGNSLAGPWIERFSVKDLSRVVADTSVVFPMLVPWNMFAILSGKIIGVPSESYTPYAFFALGLPVATLCLSFLRERIQRTG
ncbi:MAG: Na+/H+ antiporter NhaC family protein [Solirubrobacterales bacterium]